MKTTPNKTYTAPRASEPGAYMGTKITVPLARNLSAPTPTFKAPDPKECKSATTFKTNTGKTL